MLNQWSSVVVVSRYLLPLLTLMVALLARGARSEDLRHALFRDLADGTAGAAGAAGGTRRVFGGTAAELADFPAAAVLLDRYWAPRCSAAVLAQRWALTAAHCVTTRLAYVKYNTRKPAARDGQLASVLYLYRHPQFKVVQEDEGRGMDVTVLHHDVGLVRTSSDMVLTLRMRVDPLVAFSDEQSSPMALRNSEVDVLGFGRSEDGPLGAELVGARLRLVACERGAWRYCVCGVAAGGSRGVCAGDSGGPVVRGGMQVAVTSMGPLQCASGSGVPGPSATSVFTVLQPYSQLINSTMFDTENALRMSRVSAGGRAAPLAALLAAPLSTLLCR